MPRSNFEKCIALSMFTIAAVGPAQARPCKYQDLASVTGVIADAFFDGDEGTVKLKTGETKPLSDGATGCSVTELIVVEWPAGCDKGKQITASGRIHIKSFVLDADDIACK